MELMALKDSDVLILSNASPKDALAIGATWNAKAGRWECDKLLAAIAVYCLRVKALGNAYATIENELKSIRQMYELSHSLKPLSAIEIPEPIHLCYHPYQKTAIEYIEQTGGRCIVADDMGCGKTIEAIGWLNLHTEKRPCLVVTTASMKLFWVQKINEWLIGWNDVKSLNGKGGQVPESDVLVTNYDLLPAYKEQLVKFAPQVVILDEAHYLKNPKAQRTKAALEICRKTPHIIALTGTPIVNRPIEAWSLLHLLKPNIFKNWKQYVVRYCGGYQDNWGHWYTKGASHTDELAKKLRATCMIRRLKDQVLPQLPSKIRTYVEVELSKNVLDKERAQLQDAKFLLMQRSIELKNIESLPDEKRVQEKKKFNEKIAQENINILAALEKSKAQIALAKIPMVEELVNSILETGEKVVVFAHHKEVIKALAKTYYNAAVVTGDTPANARFSEQQRFLTDNLCNVFLGSLKACREGLDLTASRNIVFAELDWVPGYIKQAEDRCHRLGQKKAVNIYYVTAADSVIEKYMLNTLKSKEPVLSNILDNQAVSNFEVFLKELLETA